MYNIIKEILLSIFPIIISLYSLHCTNKNSENIQKTNEFATNISVGQIELFISNSITQSQNRVADLAISISKYFDRTLTTEEKNQYNALKDALIHAIESNLNTYEEACAKYIDGKLDKKRFKRMYFTEIKRLVNDNPSNIDFSQANCPYKCILKVYNDWFDLEK